MSISCITAEKKNTMNVAPVLGMPTLMHGKYKCRTMGGWIQMKIWLRTVPCLASLSIRAVEWIIHSFSYLASNALGDSRDASRRTNWSYSTNLCRTCWMYWGCECEWNGKTLEAHPYINYSLQWRKWMAATRHTAHVYVHSITKH